MAGRQKNLLAREFAAGETILVSLRHWLGCLTFSRTEWLRRQTDYSSGQRAFSEIRAVSLTVKPLPTRKDMRWVVDRDAFTLPFIYKLKRTLLLVFYTIPTKLLYYNYCNYR